jgi:small subunit ribosomal protein S13
MRVAGVTIPTENQIVIALQYIYGVGPKVAGDVCVQAKLDPILRVKDLTADQEEKIRQALVKLEIILEADLRRELSQNIKRLQDIGSYRGFRHRRRLPVRGQNTKSNAKTRKGKGAAVAGKKKVTK